MMGDPPSRTGVIARHGEMRHVPDPFRDWGDFSDAFERAPPGAEPRRHGEEQVSMHIASRQSGLRLSGAFSSTLPVCASGVGACCWRQPHDCVFPERKDAARTVLVRPHSRRVSRACPGQQTEGDFPMSDKPKRARTKETRIHHIRISGTEAC
jgi:hypothetical protein